MATFIFTKRNDNTRLRRKSKKLPIKSVQLIANENPI